MSKFEDKKEEVEKKVLPYVHSPSPSRLPIPASDTLYIACMIANPRNVFFDIDIAGEKAGRIVFKLYDDIVPKVRPLPFFIFGHKLSNRPQQTSEDLQLERNPIRMKIYLKDSDTKGLISIELFRVL
jgi:hypothetical protein